MKIVLLESPLAGDMEANKRYAREAMRDSLMRGEAPFASHLLYTQCLDDTIPEERIIGIEAGLYLGRCADITAVYIDLGISDGMKLGIDRAVREGRPIIYRSIKEVAQT